MKMTQEDFTGLEKAIECRFKNHRHTDDKQTLINYYKHRGLSKTRFAWDLFFNVTDRVLINKLYGYLHADHIQTALFKIIGKY